DAVTGVLVVRGMLAGPRAVTSALPRRMLGMSADRIVAAELRIAGVSSAVHPALPCVMEGIANERARATLRLMSRVRAPVGAVHREAEPAGHHVSVGGHGSPGDHVASVRKRRHLDRKLGARRRRQTAQILLA